ncbi:DUF305 domain-containing protein [Amycolatopsis sp. NPDC004368]
MYKTIVGTGMAVLAAGLLLAGCGSGDNTGHPGMTVGTSPRASSSAPAAHNDADVAFAQQMIPHHRQAVAMAAMAVSQASSPQVKDLAGRIQQAQDPEIQLMTSWLTQWGAAASGSMPGMDHGSMPASSMPAMPGMMSDAYMQKLQQASGAAFDRMFLQMMVTHHQGAVAMGKTELASGSSPDAKALAQRIIDSQTAEIAQMQQMLGQS